MELQLECYLVGGAVRDTLLGREVGDRDWVVVGSSVAEMLQLGFTQVGRDFPVFLHPQTHEEYALARTEKKSGVGHTGFVVHASPEVTLQQDLLRRDLTINAMAMDADGRLIDEFGGQQDLARQSLRHVSPAFAEDPLRVLRVARFAAQLPGFTVAAETAALMRSMCAAGALDTLSAERVWTETVKALAAPAASRYWQVLADCGALQPWFAELQDAVARGELEEVPAELGALGRFVHLPLNAQQLAGFCQRLKVSKHFQQVAEDQRAFGALLVNWPQAHAQSVCDMLTRLQVHHDRRRLDNLLQVSPDVVAADALHRLAEGFAQVRLEPAPPPGPAYGQALAAARLAQVEAGLAGL